MASRYVHCGGAPHCLADHVPNSGPSGERTRGGAGRTLHQAWWLSAANADNVLSRLCFRSSTSEQGSLRILRWASVPIRNSIGCALGSSRHGSGIEIGAPGSPRGQYGAMVDLPRTFMLKSRNTLSLRLLVSHCGRDRRSGALETSRCSADCLGHPAHHVVAQRRRLSARSRAAPSCRSSSYSSAAPCRRAPPSSRTPPACPCREPRSFGSGSPPLPLATGVDVRVHVEQHVVREVHLPVARRPSPIRGSARARSASARGDLRTHAPVPDVDL